MLFKSSYLSPLGNLILLCDAKERLIEVCFKTQQKKHKEAMEVNETLEVFIQTKSWLNRYFCGDKPNISELSLMPLGSAFQQEVWKILCTIPYGITLSYSEVAEEIARNRGLKKMSAQAVGRAIGANPLAIIIPCHRVIGKNGALMGYAGGLEIKKKLLEHEKATRN